VLCDGQDLASDVLQLHRREAAMMDFKVAIRTTLLLVGDHIQQLDVRALVLQMPAFTMCEVRRSQSVSN
jgi:hypothetical protein